jgi:PilZ domain
VPVAFFVRHALTPGAIRILPRMPLAEWLQAFRTLHERAKAGRLSPEERSAYLAGREELARALVAAQRLSLTPGTRPREALRVARALQVDLETPLSRERAMTMTLSIGGFSALLAKAPRPDEELRCTFRIPGGESIETTARPVGTKPRAGSVSVSFAFGKLGDADRERLELVIFDTVLEQLVR